MDKNWEAYLVGVSEYWENERTELKREREAIHFAKKELLKQQTALFASLRSTNVPALKNSNVNVGDDDRVIKNLRRQLGEIEACVIKKDGVFSIRCGVCNVDVKAASQKRGIKKQTINWQAQPFLRHLKTKQHIKRLGRGK